MFKSSSSTKITKSAIDLMNFSFMEHKSSYEKFLFDAKQNLIVEDKLDFWKFINKYEATLKAMGQPILPKALNESDYLLLHPYHKMKLNQLQLTVSVEHQFQEIILIYLDFKQKEKFSKVKKLRRSQETLPISRFKKDFQETLSDERFKVLIIAGDTGCGKSTQVPQYLHEFGYRNIACTQPRRLACVSLSKRVAHEMLDDYGSKVGFQIRFEKNKTSNTNILFITEGLLLRQLAVPNNVELYDVLILDEIHERNLFGDFLLGVTKCLLRARPTLKLILMSATINVDLFHSYFKDEGAKLVEVPGRLFPIKTMWMPPPSLELKGERQAHSKTSGRLDPAPFVQVLNLIDQKFSTNERGDVLIFVSGVNEITTVCDAIQEYAEQNSHWIILPLHSGLALAEQDKVFDYAPDGMRKCIVSTNIAETSLTVDGIRFVIDSGKVKEMSYESACRGQRLKEFWVSKSSAEQRKGRAGRTGPGTCFRLFSEIQYQTFEMYPTPEILRVPLDTILLQMVAMGLPNVRVFPFIESPPPESIERTILTLKQHNALTPDEKITSLGKSLSTLPVDISIGKMLLMGCVFPDIEKILTLAAILSVQNPFTTRAYTDPKCEERRSYLETDQGDIFILFRAFHEWLRLKRDKESTRKWSAKLGIEEQRFYEITKLRHQFQNILESCNMTSKRSEPSFSSADRARRHGEVRMLKAIKRKQKYQEPRKRKFLKTSSHADSENYTDDMEDMRDVDFRLRNDETKLKLLIDSSRSEKMRDVLLLKLIILSGFYPQLAIGDDFNYCKSGSQQFFHTVLKPFISIHPNAYFAKNYDILRLNDSDILEKPAYYTPKQVLSSRHQILCYQNLLETTKPYLMNCIRMPAAQCLLLFSFTIDTNIAVSRIVCDSWICLEFPTPSTGCELLIRAIKLRKLWANLLSKKLTDLTDNLSSTSGNSIKTLAETDLWESLIDFMSANVAYTIKRLLPADLKNLYTHLDPPNANEFTTNPFDKNLPISRSEEKGGINVTENVVYGCLRENQWTNAMDSMLSEQDWTCKECNFEMKFDTIRKLMHEKNCEKKQRTKEDMKPIAESNEDNVNSHTSRGFVKYFCKICRKDLFLSKIDTLRHRKHCDRR